MKKVFDQTYRDIRREVNKKVLKVPGIEQKVLDVTSNEPWGPHGSIMADIAQATRNYHEYQIIMSVLWKRLNDIGRNWRHVYKSLTVLDYLVGNGSERVIDDLREHAYQISTLSDFQYVDSHGKDGDRYGRDDGERYNRDGDRYRDDEYGAGKDNEEDRYGSRKGDKDKDHAYEDDDRYSSRNGGRTSDYGPDETKTVRRKNGSSSKL